MRSEPFFEILPARQLKVWRQLKSESVFLNKQGYYLAGGTALALQLGHRQSVDFDFFSRSKKISARTRRWLESFSVITIRDQDADTLHVDMGGVKLSFIGSYQYPRVYPAVDIDKISVADVREIGLMKLLAITHRATARDYIDLAAILSQSASLKELLEKSFAKYGPGYNPMLSLKALVSFKDLDLEMPQGLDRNLSKTWKQTLLQAVRECCHET